MKEKQDLKTKQLKLANLYTHDRNKKKKKKVKFENYDQACFKITTVRFISLFKKISKS